VGVVLFFMGHRWGSPDRQSKALFEIYLEKLVLVRSSTWEGPYFALVKKRATARNAHFD
jgi:hypothetical protein